LGNKSALLGGQAREHLEDALNLDLCSHQTNIRAKLPETEYTKKIPEAPRILAQKPGTFVPGIAADPRPCGGATRRSSTRGPVSSSRRVLCL